MSYMSSIARRGLLIVGVAFISSGAAGAKAQQFIPDIIISSTIPGDGDLNLTA
jgi:hypothetical protein